MGVNNLWSILEPVRRKENLSALSNKTLSVDLSGWICEAQCAKGLKQHVSKPHLRNLFFRLLHLTRLGVKLVFVVDGKPPEVKWNAIAKRIQARQHGGQFWNATNPGKAGSAARVGRSDFAVWVRECHTLLNLFGVPCIESAGEAEALCAWLDLHHDQIVDGCITNDGDAFLYGARTVYKDICTSGKDASVECYKLEEIEAKLNLNRQKLVALGILLGCDYLPQGVAGVGKQIAMKLIKNVNHDNLIERFYEWAKGTDLDENLSKVEKSVKCKALKDKNFPHPEVIQEFLTPKVVPQDFHSRCSLKITNPDLQGLQEFCLKNLQWLKEYTREKVVPFITYWQMTSSLQDDTATLVKPERIVKARIQQKIECYEVEWQNVQLGETCPASFVTTETKQLFAQVYPELVKEFNDNEAEKLSKKSPKKTPKKSNAENSDVSCDDNVSDERRKSHSKKKKARREEREEGQSKEKSKRKQKEKKQREIQYIYVTDSESSSETYHDETGPTSLDHGNVDAGNITCDGTIQTIDVSVSEVKRRLLEGNAPAKHSAIRNWAPVKKRKQNAELKRRLRELSQTRDSEALVERTPEQEKSLNEMKKRVEKNFPQATLINEMKMVCNVCKTTVLLNQLYDEDCFEKKHVANGRCGRLKEKQGLKKPEPSTSGQRPVTSWLTP